MASGHVNRTQRPHTWLHRPSLRREESSCQLGAVHTWPISTCCVAARLRSQTGHAEVLKLEPGASPVARDPEPDN